MVVVYSERDVVSTYVGEGLRRLWAASVDENGEFANFDYACNHADYINGQRDIHFNDVYCSENLQRKIIDDLVKEPYCTPSGKVYKLKNSRDIEAIKINITLGPSPWSCKRTFADSHPNFRKIEKKFE